VSFVKWLRQFEGEESPVGDLARDIRRDKEFPKTKGHKGIREYLEGRNACEECLNAFEVVWEKYTKEVERNE
jgi:uncharacterized protein YozE (UPF0346 family)